MGEKPSPKIPSRDMPAKHDPFVEQVYRNRPPSRHDASLLKTEPAKLLPPAESEKPGSGMAGGRLIGGNTLAGGNTANRPGGNTTGTQGTQTQTGGGSAPTITGSVGSEETGTTSISTMLRRRFGERIIRSGVSSRGALEQLVHYCSDTFELAQVDIGPLIGLPPVWYTEMTNGSNSIEMPDAIRIADALEPYVRNPQAWSRTHRVTDASMRATHTELFDHLATQVRDGLSQKIATGQVSPEAIGELDAMITHCMSEPDAGLRGTVGPLVDAIWKGCDLGTKSLGSVLYTPMSNLRYNRLGNSDAEKRTAKRRLNEFAAIAVQNRSKGQDGTDPTEPTFVPASTAAIRSREHIRAIIELKAKLTERLPPEQVNAAFAALGVPDHMLIRPQTYFSQLRNITLGMVVSGLQGNVPDAVFYDNDLLKTDLPLIKADRMPLTSEALPYRISAFVFLLAQHWNERTQAPKGNTDQGTQPPTGGGQDAAKNPIPLPPDIRTLLQDIASGRHPISNDSQGPGRESRNALFLHIEPHIIRAGITSQQINDIVGRGNSWHHNMISPSARTSLTEQQFRNFAGELLVVLDAEKVASAPTGETAPDRWEFRSARKSWDISGGGRW